MAMAVTTLIMGVIAMNLSKFSAVRVWCGATLLWRFGRLAPPNEGQASEETGLLARSNEGGSIPLLQTKSGCWPRGGLLTIHSSRTVFAGRLNSGGSHQVRQWGV